MPMTHPPTSRRLDDDRSAWKILHLQLVNAGERTTADTQWDFATNQGASWKIGDNYVVVYQRNINQKMYFPWHTIEYMTETWEYRDE